VRDLFDMTDKVIVVTGGSRGLGKEMSLAFAERGATVVVASRKLASCEELVARIESDGGRAVAVAAHVGKWDDCDRLIETVYDQFGRIDVLVNNAGMAPLYPSLPEVSEELFDKVLAVNVRGPFRLSVLAATRMTADDGAGGAIINVSSLASIRATESELPYGLAKAALNLLTTTLANTYGPKVRANTIMCGPFTTDISEAWDFDAFERDTAPAIPAGRAGRPDEVVGTALYLASDASSYTSGATIPVDGGWATVPAGRLPKDR
jgi:NAD(P)-dependent dehydrogenase (short-subunit alcohol dehydrogenase family)